MEPGIRLSFVKTSEFRGGGAGVWTSQPPIPRYATVCTCWLQYRKLLQVMFKVSPASLQTFIATRLTPTPSVIHNSNYVIMVSDWNCFTLHPLTCRMWWAPNNASKWQRGVNWVFKGLNSFWVFLCCNDQVRTDLLITLYNHHISL
jgi:hypothetical protein